MSDKTYTVLAILEAIHGKEDELEKMLTALVAPTLKEDGCINYDLHKSSNHPAVFMFYENWKNKDAHALHCDTSHIKAWQARMHELLATPYDVTFWKVLKG